MSGRRWTEEELAYLEEKADTMSTYAIAKALKRSYNSVNLKASREGIPLFNTSTELLSAYAIATMMGVESRAVYRWHRYGLKYKRINGRLMHKQNDLIKFLKDNPDLWNATKGDPYLISMYPWFQEKYEKDLAKKKANPNQTKNWSKTDMQTLVHLRDKGWNYRQLAERYGHSANACKQKYCEIKRMEREKREKVGAVQQHGRSDHRLHRA